jgi:hypothetical protein
MKLSNNKMVCYFKKLMIILIFILIPLISTAQNLKNPALPDTSIYLPSDYSFGLILGYTGLFKGSGLTEIVPGKDYIDGLSFGFIFEYNFEGTKAALQVLSETNQLNIDFAGKNNDNYEMSSFNLLGIKAFTGILKGIYIIPAVGIMTGKETLFIRSLNLGYEFNDKKKTSFFYQIGYAETDYKDRFLTVRMGIGIDL